ncbi:hypothetical protein ACVWWG_000439 [Bradyrhizobium sp. LB7.2]
MTAWVICALACACSASRAAMRLSCNVAIMRVQSRAFSAATRPLASRAMSWTVPNPVPVTA